MSTMEAANKDAPDADAATDFEEAPDTVAERFWSVALQMEGESTSTEPKAVVGHVLAVMDAFEDGQVGEGLTARTRSFLALLRRAEIRGDLVYASPEQARGERVDERSLVFSVGVLLFERLTGRHPFGAEAGNRRLARIRKGEMGSGVNFFPTVPARLRNILMRAMGPFPQERWQTLSALRAELEDFLDDAPSLDHEPILRGVADVAAPVAAAEDLEEGDDEEPATQASGEVEADEPRETPAMATLPVQPRRLEVVESSELRAVPPEPVETSEEAVPQRRDDELSDAFAMAKTYRLSRLQKAAPLAWAAIGAAIASLAFMIFSPNAPVGVRGAGAAKPAATVAVKQAAAEPQVDAQPQVSALESETEEAEAEAAETGAATEEAKAEKAVKADVFDAEMSAAGLLQAVETCLEGRDQAAFGVSLLFGPGGVSKKLFMGQSKLNGDERNCLGRELVGIEAGKADRRVIVEYAIRVRGGAASVTVRKVK